MSNYKGTYDGQSLKHYHTKGSRNGYSKDPNYTPIGEKARSPEQHPAYGPATIAGHGQGVYRHNNLVNTFTAPARVALNARDVNKQATRTNNMKAAEQRRIAGAVDKNAVEAMRKARMREAEQRRIAGGRPSGTGTAVDRFKDSAKELRDNISNFGERADNRARTILKGDRKLSESIRNIKNYANRQAIIERDRERMGPRAYAEQTQKNINKHDPYNSATDMFSRTFKTIGKGRVDQAKEVGRNIAKTAKTAGEVGSSLVKKGKKKVKKLMSKWFG